MGKVILGVSFLFILASSGFSTTHTIVSSGLTFSPNTLTIDLGDTIKFALSSIHNAAEVSQATWNANGTTSNGGFILPFGGGTLVLTNPGIHYFVCQVHGPMGMKGIITVNAAPPPNSLTIRSIIDQDGNISSTNDEVFKKWSLKLFKDSIASGIVIDSIGSGDSMSVNHLGAGTYVAVEADSQFWSHISINLDGVSEGITPLNQWNITLTSGETHVIDFINFSPITIINSGLVFVPDSLVVLQGERIQFVLEPVHNAHEVNQATWLANDTVTNGGFQIPFGGGSIVFPDTGTHYYISTPDANTSMKGRIFVVPESTIVAVGSTLISGWNLISLPVRATDNSVSVIFPNSVSQAFTYQGSYVPLTTMTNGYGYWLKFNDSQSVSINGFSLLRDSLAVQKGWNIIGSISTPFAATGLSSRPPGIIVSTLFGFNGTYFTADTIVPGFGYWLRTSQIGEIYLNSATNAMIRPAKEELLHSAGELEVRDNDGKKKTLYLVDGGAETPGMRLMEELPPVPPAGAFDVRFSSGDQLKKLGDSPTEKFPIKISAAVYPITLRWNMESLHQPVSLYLDGSGAVLNGSGSIGIAHPVQSISLEAVNPQTQPKDYFLDQAFPNPFNPSTLIRYNLPVRSYVRLKVFNIIGQEITTLVNDVQDDGERSAVWNPTDISSGIYFIKLDAVSSAGANRSFHRVVKVALQK